MINSIPFDKVESWGSIVERAFGIALAVYFLAPPVLFLFVLIYAITLGESKRMNWRIGLAACLFAVNFLIQGILLFLIWGRGQGG